MKRRRLGALAVAKLEVSGKHLRIGRPSTARPVCTLLASRFSLHPVVVLDIEPINTVAKRRLLAVGVTAEHAQYRFGWSEPACEKPEENFRVWDADTHGPAI